jgi:uncharacterized protein (DUF2062 family)
MPRRLLKKLTPSASALRDRWFVRIFGERIADPRLWGLQRRAVTAAFGAGLAICFIPLPVHMIVAGIAAVLWRLNLPAIYGTIFLVNPITAVPVYYLAYRVGAALLGVSAQSFPHGPAFALSWEWLQNGFGPLWKPFLLGCVACAILAGLLGWLGLELIWRWRVTSRYRARHEATA